MENLKSDERKHSLILVTVPIGNLKDISERAKETLSGAQIIIAEDTRNIRKLLGLLQIDSSQKKFYSMNDHTPLSELEKYLNFLEYGDLVVVSDAGSPIFSDPAYPLLKLAIDEGYTLKTVSGITAVTAALEISGLPSTPFHFYGFFPRKEVEQKKMLRWIRLLPGTHLFFESPLRVEESMNLLSQELPEANFALCREITKKFETVYRFKGANWSSIKQEIKFLGEFVLLLHFEGEKGDVDLKELLLSFHKAKELSLEILQSGIKTKKIAKLLSLILGRDSKDVYNDLSLNDRST